MPMFWRNIGDAFNKSARAISLNSSEGIEMGLHFVMFASTKCLHCFNSFLLTAKLLCIVAYTWHHQLLRNYDNWTLQSLHLQYHVHLQNCSDKYLSHSSIHPTFTGIRRNSTYKTNPKLAKSIARKDKGRNNFLRSKLNSIGSRRHPAGQLSCWGLTCKILLCTPLQQERKAHETGLHGTSIFWWGATHFGEIAILLYVCNMVLWFSYSFTFLCWVVRKLEIFLCLCWIMNAILECILVFRVD